MMEWTLSLKVILLAAIQGISEIFPISSSAHLVLSGHIFHLAIPYHLILFFHIGSFGAILIHYRKKVWNLGRGKEGWGIIAKMAAAFLATALVGFSIKRFASEYVTEQPSVIAHLWILNGFLIALFSLIAPKGTLGIKDFPLFKFILLGMIQGITAIPGISRLGLTLGIGLLLGLTWFDALDLSFLLSLPTLFFANLYGVLERYGWIPWVQDTPGNTGISLGGLETTSLPEPFLILVVLVITLVVSLIAIRILSKYLNRYLLFYFGMYCITAGAFFIPYMKLF